MGPVIELKRSSRFDVRLPRTWEWLRFLAGWLRAEARPSLKELFHDTEQRNAALESFGRHLHEDERARGDYVNLLLGVTDRRRTIRRRFQTAWGFNSLWRALVPGGNRLASPQVVMQVGVDDRRVTPWWADHFDATLGYPGEGPESPRRHPRIGDIDGDAGLEEELQALFADLRAAHGSSADGPEFPMPSRPPPRPDPAPSRATTSQDGSPGGLRPPSEARPKLACLFTPAQGPSVSARSNTASGSAASASPPRQVYTAPCDRCGVVLTDDGLVPYAGEEYVELLCYRCWQRTIRGPHPDAIPTTISEVCLMDHQLLLVHTDDVGTCDRCRMPHFRGDTVFECDTCQERWTYCHECKHESDLRPSEAQRRNNAMARNAP